ASSRGFRGASAFAALRGGALGVAGARPILAVEGRALSRHLDQRRRRPEASAVLRVEVGQPPDDLFRADVIDVAKRTAAEGREAEPEDRADVAVARAPEDALAEAMGGLVHEP